MAFPVATEKQLREVTSHTYFARCNWPVSPPKPAAPALDLSAVTENCVTMADFLMGQQDDDPHIRPPQPPKRPTSRQRWIAECLSSKEICASRAIDFSFLIEEISEEAPAKQEDYYTHQDTEMQSSGGAETISVSPK